VNRRTSARGETFVRDLEDADWHSPLSPPYDAAVVANALHWFTPKRVGEIATDVLRLLRAGGAFIVVEPTRADTPFRAGFEAWTETQAPRYGHENWERFWSRAKQLLGYDQQSCSARDFRAGSRSGRSQTGSGS
jgi:hypothetical protein